MSIDNATLTVLVEEIRAALLQKSVDAVLAVDERSFILKFGRKALLLCLQEPFLRIHLIEKSYATKENLFAVKLQAYILGKTLVSVAQLNQDRILQLDFKNFSLIAELFPKRPNLYLIDAENKILLSLNPAEQPVYVLPQKPNQAQHTSEKLTSRQLEAFYLKAAFEHTKKAEQKKLAQRKKQLLKAEKSYLNDLERAKSWRSKQHAAELLQANLFRIKRGMERVELLDWEQENQPCSI